ncbi:MAG: TonB-linked SusC/RagA family outer membrane protein [Marinoscillum sp.]|jgi:TonB-linked SusC/RagA family outer membrane protein
MRYIILLIAFFPLLLIGQTMKVTGTVSSSSLGETLPGATVQVKGTGNGTTTDIDGQFTIEAQKGDLLVISFIGFETNEVKVTSDVIKVDLEDNTEELEEVVVVSQGYFDVEKEFLTSATVQVGSEEISRVRGNSIENILQGQVSGVVVSESAEPGGGIGISIRGTNSILGGTQPLYVVDGIPINPIEDAQGNGGGGQSQSSLSFLNPNDIDKVEIMKDAAATALYGARGANGVVIITTKTADKSDGKHSFDIVIDQTLAEVNNKLDVLNGPEFEHYMNQRALNQLYSNITDPNTPGGIVFDGTQQLTAENFPALATFELPYQTSTGINTDWQDLTYRQAYSNAVNLSYRGGSPDGTVAISLGVLNNQGVILNSDFNRVTFSINASRNAGSSLKIFSKTNLARSWGNASSSGNGEIFEQRGIVSQTLQFQPIFDRLAAGEDDDAYADLNDGNAVSNPYTLATDVTDQKKAFNLLQSLSTVYDINKHLTATVKGAFNYQRSTRDSYFPTTTTRGRRNGGEATQAYNDRFKGYLEANVRYQKQIKKHRIDAIAIGTYEQTNDRRLFSKAFGFGNDETAFYTFESATDILVPVTVFNQFSLLSGLTRVGYNYQKKYFIDVNARVDASSKFAENQRAAFFPSASLGWIASREKFLKNVKAVSFMKVRASYGQTGSNPIAPFQSLALMSPIRYNFDNSLVTGFYQANLSNPDLTWETTDQFNAGLDLNLFDARIRITFDAYLKQTNNLLQQVRLPASNGYAEIIDNFGSIENKGFDLSVGADLVNKDAFQWNTNVNFSRNRNELLELNSNLDFQLGPVVGFTRTNPILFKEGSPLGIFWGAQTEGIYANWEEANASGIEGAAPGEIKYINHSLDLDENGEPLAVQLINFDDYVQIGDPNPDFTYAVTNNFSYGKWDLSVLITGQKGGDIFWVDSWQLAGLNASRNILKSAYDQSWRAPFTYTQGADGFSYDPFSDGTERATNPAPFSGDTGARALPSNRQIHDGSFVRLKNINLGYTLPFKSGQSMRMYVSGRNLFTITEYPGYDPETQAYNKDPQRRGVDFGTYPGVKSYILGLSLNF